MSQLEPIYLDNAATTRVDPRVATVVSECMQADYGNPASAHQAGIVAERRIKVAREQLATAIGDGAGVHGRIIWTSGGTESDALGVLGAGRAKKHLKRVVVSQVEHPAVTQSAAMLVQGGWTLGTLAVNAQGTIARDDVAGAVAKVVDAKTGVLAVMLVNNEIGTVLPVREIADAARNISPQIHVHCDAVQALGKIAISVPALGVDSVAFAAHKLHGPKGVGALWLKKGARFVPFWAGGGQQEGLRSGTENVPGIAGMGAAVALACEDLPARQARHRGFAEQLIAACQTANLRFLINGEHSERAPHVLSLAFADCPAEPTLHVLESRGVFVSAGSACSERNRKPSAVLQALGLPKNYGTLRFSFGRDTSEQDITNASEILVDAIHSFQS